MNYHKIIEYYAGRTVKLDEYLISLIKVDDVEKLIIIEWNLEIEQPTIQQLQTIYNDNKIQIKKEQKEKELKSKYYQDAIDDLLSKYKPYSDKKTELDSKTTEKEIDDFIL